MYITITCDAHVNADISKIHILYKNSENYYSADVKEVALCQIYLYMYIFEKDLYLRKK